MRVLTLFGFAAAATLTGTSLSPATAAIPRFQRGIIPQAVTWRTNVLPPGFQQRAFQYAAQHRSKILPAQSGPVKEWLMDDSGFIWGLNGQTIVSFLTDCSGAEGGIVDHSGRLVVACTNSKTVNIYNAGNTTGPANVVLSDLVGKGFFATLYFPAAAFEDNAGNIYATNLDGTRNGSVSVNGNIVWWKANKQQNNATPSGSYSDPNLVEDFFGDVDKTGTVYVDGFSFSFFPEVDAITNIMSKNGASATNLDIALSFPGGVYVVSPNKPRPLLSVIDQGSFGVGNDALYQFSLPVSPGATPITTSHPPQNLTSTCDPVAGGYNRKETIKIGDAGCHAADIGDPATDTWKQLLNIDFSIPIDGAFIPSDK
jgi:hypothetical protein